MRYKKKSVRSMELSVLNDVNEALLDKMSEQLQNGVVDAEKIMEMLGPSMKAGRQMLEMVFKGMVNASMNSTSKGPGSSSKKGSKD